MKEAEDYAIDRALREVVGEDSPPDNTFQIVAAIGAARRQVPRHAARRPWGIGLLCGAAVALIGFLVFWSVDPVVPTLDIRVALGEVTWRQATQESHASAPQSMAITPRVHDRILAHPLRLTKLHVASFGTLELTPGTDLEITDMEWKQFGVGFGTGSITVAVLAGAIHWLSGDAVTTAKAGETSKLDMDRAADEATAEGSERERKLMQELAAAKLKLEQLEQESTRVALEPVRKEPPKPAVVESDEFQPLSDYPQIRALLKSADWKAVASSTLELTDITREMFDLLAAGEDVPREMLGELRRIEGIMHKYGALVEGDESIEGLSFETKVRHPIIGSNWLAMCLQSAKMPLSKEQRQMLANLTDVYTKEDAQRRVGYRDNVMDVERYLDEMEMQDRFYAEARSVLKPDQIAKLFPGKFKGRSGASPIGEGSAAWHDWVQSPAYATKADFVDSMSGAWSRGMELNDTQKSGLTKIMQKWIDAYPADLWKNPKDKLTRYGFHDVERVRQSARLQLKYFEQMRSTLNLTPKQLDFLRKIHTIIVPYRK